MCNPAPLAVGDVFICAYVKRVLQRAVDCGVFRAGEFAQAVGVRLYTSLMLWSESCRAETF